jgi:propionyl-CoA carboxylase alpha chain
VDGQLGKRLQPPADWQVHVGGANHDVSISTDGITVDGEDLDIELEYTPGDRIVEAVIHTDLPEPVQGSSSGLPLKEAASTSSAKSELLAVRILRTRAGFKLTTRGASHIARVLPAHVAPLSAHMIEKIPPDLSRFLLSPMPGLLTALHVSAGDKVEAGQPLAVIEAMKMENILRAGKTGTVKEISAATGDSLAVDQVILELD